MASTYTLINSATGSGNPSSITFSPISQDYSDLFLSMSFRTTAGEGYPTVRFNNDSNNNYRNVDIYWQNSTATSRMSNPANSISLNIGCGTGYGSNLFSQHKLYIPDYKSSTIKATSSDNFICKTTWNPQDNYSAILAGQWNGSTAITSITILTNNANFDSGTSISLYGIKRS